MADTKAPDSFLEAYAVGRKVLRVSLETLAVVKLELFFHDVHLSSATGFIYRYADNYILATNLHVLNGVNPNTDKIIDKRGFVPNKIRFYMNLFGDKFGSFDVTPFNADLLNDAKPIWYESPLASPIVDVAMIELAETIENFEQIKARIIYLKGGRMLVECDETGNARFAFTLILGSGRTSIFLDFQGESGKEHFQSGRMDLSQRSHYMAYLDRPSISRRGDEGGDVWFSCIVLWDRTCWGARPW